MPTKLKILRIIAGRKQLEVARKTRIPVSTLSQIECGWRVPNSSQLKKLVREFPELAGESVEIPIR